MNNNITLSELIKELQSIESECGNVEVVSIGSCNGQFEDMRNPFTIRLSRKNDKVTRAYIATQKEDIGKSCVKDEVF